MGKNKTIIKQETWTRLFIINYYQEFIREWFNLYDAYIRSNPKPPKELQVQCIDLVIQHFQKVKDNLNG